MTHLLAVTSIALYIVATVLVLIQLWRPGRKGLKQRFAQSQLIPWTFYLAFGLHTATIGFVFNDARYLLLDNGADYFLCVSWGLAGVFAFLQRRLNYPIVGAFVIPAIVLFMGSSSYLLHSSATSLLSAPAAQTNEGLLLSLLHGIPALVAVVSLALALVISVVFLIVEYRLKQRGVGALNVAGPNLQFLDLLNRQLAQVGFVAISLVVLSGGLWAVSAQRPIFSLDTSLISGLATWILLAFVLHARLVLKWSPRQVSRLTVLITGSFFLFVFVVMIWSGRLTHASIWL